MKKTCVAIALALSILAMLSGCEKGAEKQPGMDGIQPGSESEDQPGVSDTHKNDEIIEDTDDFDPDADYIQNYSIDGIAYCEYDSDILWVYVDGEGRDESFRAAIDETGKIYSKIYENYGSLTGYLCSSEYFCLYKKDVSSLVGTQTLYFYDDHQIFTCDGTEITASFLDESEEIWRVTKTDDKLIIWKYEAIETYSSVKYILRVCDTNGNLLLELDGDEYPAVANALSAEKLFLKEDQVLKELGSGLYQIGDIYLDVILREVYGPDQYGLGNLAAVYDRCVFSGIECEDSNDFTRRYKSLTVYKIGTDEPLFTWASDTDMFLPNGVENGVFMTYSRGETISGGVLGHTYNYALPVEPKKYYDAATGEFLAEYDTAKIGAERIYYFNGENAIAEIKNPAGTRFITLIDRDGQFLFEPLQEKISSFRDWREELGAVMFYYDGTGYEGEGFYLLSEDGAMKSLHIMDADKILFNHNNRMIVINDGEYSLYDMEGNKIR